MTGGSSGHQEDVAQLRLSKVPEYSETPTGRRWEKDGGSGHSAAGTLTSCDKIQKRLKDLKEAFWTV